MEEPFQPYRNKVIFMNFKDLYSTGIPVVVPHLKIVYAGSSATLKCDVASVLPIEPVDVSWWHTPDNGLEQEADGRCHFRDSVASLGIQEATPVQQGNYTCKAQNECGTGASPNMYLHVGKSYI